jgi:AcrR family transcriptional regulator
MKRGIHEDPERRRAILAAALACFSDRGVADTTIGEIRAKSGASTGSIYHHFRNKDGLARALYLEGIREYQQGFVACLERRRAAGTGIKAVIKYHFEWVNKHPDWARYLFGAAEGEFMTLATDAIRELNLDFRNRVAAWLEPHQHAGRIARLPNELFFAILLGPVQLFSRWWLAGRARQVPAKAVAALGNAAWQAVRGDTKPLITAVVDWTSKTLG